MPLAEKDPAAGGVLAVPAEETEFGLELVPPLVLDPIDAPDFGEHCRSF